MITANGPTVAEVRRDFVLDLAYNAGVDGLGAVDDLLALAAKMSGLHGMRVESEYSDGQQVLRGELP